MQSPRSIRLRSQAAIPGGGVDSCRGMRALWDIKPSSPETILAVIYSLACIPRGELGNGAPQFRSHPDRSVAKNSFLL